MKKPTTLVLKNSRHRPSKAELKEVIKLKIPGKDVYERTRDAARAVLQTVKIRHERKKLESCQQSQAKGNWSNERPEKDVSCRTIESIS